MKRTFTAASLLAAACLAGSAHANLLAYEGWDYTAGENVVDNVLNGGTGFADAWIAGQQGGKVTVYDENAETVIDGTNGGELTWNGVVDNLPQSPAVGVRFAGQGAGTADRITAQRTLSQSAGDLAGADDTLWLGYALHMEGTNFGRHVAIGLGTDGFSDRSRRADTSGNFGSGAGELIGIGGAINTGLVTPVIFNGGGDLSGGTTTRTTTGATTVSFSEDNIIILKFEFADGGTADTVTAYRFTETETLDEATFNANAISASAVIDQDTLNILSFSQSRGTGGIDEIRLGDSFLDVIGQSGPSGPAADLSGDGDVDDEDLGLFFSAFTGPDNGPSLDPRADLSGDGDVDDEDLGIAFSEFTGPLGPASVPEPASLALLGLGGVLVTRRRR